MKTDLIFQGIIHSTNCSEVGAVLEVKLKWERLILMLNISQSHKNNDRYGKCYKNVAEITIIKIQVFFFLSTPT